MNETINHMLCCGVKLKSLHINFDSDWKHPDGRYKYFFRNGIYKLKYQGKTNTVHQNTRVYLMRLWSDGFQPHNVIALSSSSLKLCTVNMANAEKYSTRFTSPFALGYK